jgi:hypothetical protein
MGANATTFVPSYTSGEVLTAANLSVTNSGVPVFASSVERDAAFGGTGEKTLAEGQYAYLEDTNATQFYDGASWASVGSVSKVVQIVTATTNTPTGNTTATYADTTLTATITPTSASNNVLVFATQNGCVKARDTGGGSPNTWFQLRLLRGATEITLGEQMGGYNNGASLITGFGTSAITYLDSPATTSATTYKTQFRGNVASTEGMSVNQQNSVSFITLMEVTP